MRLNEGEYQQRLEARKREIATERMPELRSLAQGEVLAPRLTGSEEWDAFLQIVQAMIAEARQIADARAKAIATEFSLSADELAQRRLEAAQLFGRLAALEEVQQIPSVMRKGGEEARALIERYGADETRSLS